MANIQEQAQENYSDIRRLLRIDPDPEIADLPIAQPDDARHKPALPEPGLTLNIEEAEAAVGEGLIKKFFRSKVLAYAALFLSAFILFYAVLNARSLLSQMQGWFAPAENEQILQDDWDEYYAWIGGYFFAIGNAESVEPAADLDRDGLSNMDEFVLRTNPLIADSDRDGYPDGVETLNGYNPFGSGLMTEQQASIAADLDLIKISNRIAYNSSEFIPDPSSNILGSSKINYDLTKSGRLSVPKLDLQAPIVWTADPKNFADDLTRGVVHYPGTALPGEQGVVYISGHSSDYLWKNHPYKYVFAKLNALDVGDDIFVDIYGADGKEYNYRYRVTAEQVYAPNDQRQFVDQTGAKLNLSTCWPIGSTKDRLVITAVLQDL